MNTTRLFLAAVLTAACLLPTVGRAAEPPAIEIKTVKLDELNKAIAAHKGKVVVVDFWASWCLPCREEFPNLVELHKKMADKGVVCISVSIDDPAKSATALKFLKSQEATFTNLLLDESPDALDSKLGFASIPTVFVYDKDGKRAKVFNARSAATVFTYKDVRKTVDSLLEGGK